MLSVLVPFGGDDPLREATWVWLKAYYEAHLTDFEIVVGGDPKSIQRWYRRDPDAFSKSVAVNNAFKHSCGDILLILDADAYLDTDVIMHWAERLRAQRRAGVRSWAIPYRWLMRLTHDATRALLKTDAKLPFQFDAFPGDLKVEGTDGSGFAHIYGAMAQMMPREAFIAVGGWDERFRGWGGEDRAFLQKMNTLWGPYQNSPNTIYHIWHPKNIVAAGIDVQGRRAEIRAWDDQDEPRSNDWITWQYEWANGNKARMRRVVDASKKGVSL
jgi:hypothetical protein